MSGGTKLCYSESSLSLFFNKKILQRCLRREWGEWVGTFVIEMIAGPNFWTIPFLKKNEKNLSILTSATTELRDSQL